MAIVETTLNRNELAALIESDKWAPYGDTRVYFTYPSGSQFAGQIGSIKSIVQLDKAVKDGVTEFSLKTGARDITDFISVHWVN